MLDRFSGRDLWRLVSPEAKIRIGAIALELVAAWNAAERGTRDALGNSVAGRAGEAGGELLRQVLDAAVHESLPENAFAGADSEPRIPELLGKVCAHCGCSEEDACDGGCWWSTDHLCSACARRAARAAGRRRA